MQRNAVGDPGHDLPPHKGLPLGWRMAISTAAIVFVVMGTVTVLQEAYEIRNERRTTETALRESLLLLVSRIEAADSIEEVKQEVAEFHDACVSHGIHNHDLRLRDGNGDMVVATAPALIRDRHQYRQIDLSVANPVLPDGRAQLTVRHANVEFWTNVRDRWRHWAIHFGATVVSILIFLQIAIRRLVTGPLERLLVGIRKTAMGYWGDVEDVGGAWEIRWINWRFKIMGQELNQTVRHLLDAERRAYSSEVAQVPAAAAESRQGVPEIPPSTRTDRAAVEQYLARKCRELEEVLERSPRTLALARKAIERHAVAAERIGDMAVKARLENAALRILEPEIFEEIEVRLAQHTSARREWLVGCMTALNRALDRQMVPVHDLNYRIKHTAGIWRKMRAKGLNLEQVHDLIALRIVVPTESDCYWALRVVHDVFIPVVGRFKDYIATPKANGYRSIHTCVKSSDGQVFEVQIRSNAMHEMAEYGAASHLSYKQNGQDPPAVTDNSRSWSNRITRIWARRNDVTAAWIVRR